MVSKTVNNEEKMFCDDSEGSVGDRLRLTNDKDGEVTLEWETFSFVCLSIFDDPTVNPNE